MNSAKLVPVYPWMCGKCGTKRGRLEVKANPTQFKMFEVRYTMQGELQLTAFNDHKGTVTDEIHAR